MNIKKLMGLSLIGVVAWAFFLVVNLPAAFVYQLAPVPNNVSVSNITGTVWSGQAGEVTVNNIALTDINWAIKPAAFLRQAVEADITIGDLQSPVSAEAIVRASRSEVRLQNASAEVSAQWLQSRIPTPDYVVVDVTGNVNLDVKELSFNQQGCQSLNGTVALERSRLNSPFGDIRLGSAGAELNCREGELTATVKQSSDDVQTEGLLTLSPNQRFSIAATLIPGDEMPAPLKQGLDMIARSNGDDSYSVNLSGRL